MTDREQQPPGPWPTQPDDVRPGQPRRPDTRSPTRGRSRGRSDSQRATTDLRPRLAPPDLDDPAAEDQRPGRWDWAHLADTDTVYLADALAAFVAYFNDRYAWAREHTIPPCWSHHGALVEELTTLMWSRWAAFEGPLSAAEAAQTWHTYHLPLFVARITTWIGPEAAADCRAGHHQPSRLAETDRPHNTGRRVEAPERS